MQPINKYFGKHLHKLVASSLASKLKITIKLPNKAVYNKLLSSK